MSEKEFIELYLKADEKTREAVKRILESGSPAGKGGTNADYNHRNN